MAKTFSCAGKWKKFGFPHLNFSMKIPGDLQGIGQQPVVLCFKGSTLKHISCPAKHTNSWKKKHSVHLLTVVGLFSFSYNKYRVHK